MQEIDTTPMQDALIIPLALVPKVFTPRRTEIIQYLRDHGPIRTQADLAKALDRAQSHVSVDINYLEGLGLVYRHGGLQTTERHIILQ